MKKLKINHIDDIVTIKLTKDELEYVIRTMLSGQFNSLDTEESIKRIWNNDIKFFTDRQINTNEIEVK